MKTVLFNTSTNFIIGFGEAVIDPVATKIAIKQKIENSPEAININKNNVQIAGYATQHEIEKHNAESVFYLSGKRNNKNDRDMKLLLKVAPSEAKAMLNGDEHKTLADCETRIEILKKNATEVVNKNVIESGKLEITRRGLVRSDAVYFGCKAGEIIISDIVFKDLVAKLDSKAEGNNYRVVLVGGEFDSVELVVADIVKEEVVEK